MTLVDPLSGNYFRLCGLTVDQSAQNPKQGTVLELPGLSSQGKPETLSATEWARHQATWFSATRPLDAES
ncbi:hypothetical protein NL493_30495, partial [Klebsiella pneumoniae]|nr:hypothetical protein [Klebsiella pneumoniae]